MQKKNTDCMKTYYGHITYGKKKKLFQNNIKTKNTSYIHI